MRTSLKRISDPSRDSGMATLIMLMLVAFISMLAVSVARTNLQLQNELKLLEKKHLERLKKGTITNPTPKGTAKASNETSQSENLTIRRDG